MSMEKPKTKQSDGTRQKRQAAAEERVDDFRGYVGLRSMLNPIWCFHGFRVSVVILTIFGVIMVFSSSSVYMIANDQSPWSQAIKQGAFCVLGLIVGVACMMVPAELIRRVSFAFLLVALFLQSLTFTPLGVDAQGNKGWIGLFGFTFQPAEVVKLALCVWLPRELISAQKRVSKVGPVNAYRRLITWLGLALLLVMGGKDLGTAMILFAIAGTALLLGNFPGKWLAIVACGGLALVGGLVISSPNRLNRVMATYQTCSAADMEGVCYQVVHGKYAMASGGLLGVGIGNSGEKWGYLPEAHNDFIFAIIGEETGFVGASLVILLFLVLGWCMLVVAIQAHDRYITLVLANITVWIVGQAFVNIGVVVGLFPVMGVPLPFVSAGGSSLILCLGAAGVTVSMMKQQPQIQAEIQRV